MRSEKRANMKKLILSAAILAWVLVSVPLSGPAAAAAASGAILTGVVTDSLGAPLEGATITAVPEPGRKGQSEFKVTSDKRGAFAIKALPPGAYTVIAEWRGKIIFVSSLRHARGRPDGQARYPNHPRRQHPGAQGRERFHSPNRRGSAGGVAGGVVGGVMGGVSPQPPASGASGPSSTPRNTAGSPTTPTWTP